MQPTCFFSFGINYGHFDSPGENIEVDQGLGEDN
jgi:hypothetical protein